MRREHFINITLWVGAFWGAVALMGVAGSVTDLVHRVLWNACAIVGFALMGLCFVTALVAAISDKREREELGKRKKMIPLIGMVACGIGLIGFAVWYVWPTSRENTAPIARDVNIYWVPSNGSETPVVRCQFSMLADEDRLRIFVDYSIMRGTQVISEEPRYLVAERRDVYKGQKVDIAVLRLGEFGGKQFPHKELHWGEIGPMDQSRPFVAEFDYKSDLVFIGHDGVEQRYKFRLIPDVNNLDAEIRIYQGDNY
jgi:hypothetical protein